MAILWLENPGEDEPCKTIRFDRILRNDTESVGEFRILYHYPLKVVVEGGCGCSSYQRGSGNAFAVGGIWIVGKFKSYWILWSVYDGHIFLGIAVPCDGVKN